MNSDKKGSMFEKDVCSCLKEISGVKYKPSPRSGAYRQEFPGDVMKSEQKESVFDGVILECKDRKTLAIPQWIEQAEGEMKDANLSKFVIIFNIRGKKFFLLNDTLFVKMFSS